MDSVRNMIRKRKRADMLFGVAGASLIVFALVVLGALLLRLAIDGRSRIFASHEVLESGRPPERGDVSGKLVHERDAWFIEPNALNLVGESADERLRPLLDQRVLVSGSVDGGESQIDVDEVKLMSASPRVRDKNVIGILAQDQGQWILKPQRLKLEPSTEVIARLPSMENKRVFVNGTRKTSSESFAVERISEAHSQSFIFSPPSRHAHRAGILTAWAGTLLVMIVTAMAAIPLGVAAGIYLEEYAPRNKLTAIIEINIANLAGVPSIVWGLMALGLLVYGLGLERSVLTAGLTLGLLVLPIVIIATREALRAIPGTIREAAIALGATKWQTVRYHLIPYSMSGILTGSIIAMSRAIGETAPLVTIGALTYIAFMPTGMQPEAPFFNWHFFTFRWLNSPFTVMPMQLFTWISRPDRAFHSNAAAAGVILLLMTLGMNAIAIFIRHRLRKRIKW